MSNNLLYQEQAITLGPLTISKPLCIGTWAWGDSNIWQYNDKMKGELENVFFEAVKNDFTFFDTAEVYGNGISETLLGEFNSKWNALEDSKAHSPVIMATKFAPMPWKIFQSSLNSALNGSLSRLNMKQVDLYQIHSNGVSLRSVDTWAEALVEVGKQGLVKAVGVSNYNEDEIKRTHAICSKNGIALVTNQIEFSLLRRFPETNGLLKTCKDLGITVLAYSPLGMGRLTGKYNEQNPPPDNRKFGKASISQIMPLLNKMKEIGDKYQKTPAQVALNWCICKGTIPICGVKTFSQLKDNLGAVGWRLTEEEVKELEKLGQEGNTTNFWQHG